MDFAPFLARIHAKLGVSATWTPAAGTGGQLQGEFRAPYAVASFGPVAVAGDKPTFETALPCACSAGDSLAVPGQGDFEIAEVQRDEGTGLAILILKVIR